MLSTSQMDAEMTAVMKLLNAKPVVPLEKQDTMITASTGTDSDEFDKMQAPPNTEPKFDSPTNLVTTEKILEHAKNVIDTDSDDIPPL